MRPMARYEQIRVHIRLLNVAPNPSALPDTELVSLPLTPSGCERYRAGSRDTDQHRLTS